MVTTVGVVDDKYPECNNLPKWHLPPTTFTTSQMAFTRTVDSRFRGSASNDNFIVKFQNSVCLRYSLLFLDVARAGLNCIRQFIPKQPYINSDLRPNLCEYCW